MAAGDLTPGRRVYGDTDVLSHLERPGDYHLGKLIKDGITYDRVAFYLPTADLADPLHGTKPHSGLHAVDSEIWTIVENADGTVTVSPSIACGRGSRWGEYWHGYLENGTWRQV